MATTMKYYRVSLSRLAECFEKEGFTRQMLLEFFITLGWLQNAKSPTAKGIQNGIRQSSNGDYLVFGKECWQKVKDNTYKIQRHFGLPFTVPNPEEQQQKFIQAIDINKKIPFEPLQTWILDNDYSYPYLGIRNFLIIDTETTGNSHQDEVVEIGIVDMHGNVLYESYFMPEKRFSQNAAAVNHLNKTELKKRGALLFKDEWPKIVNILKGHKILGHNLGYDKRMIIDTCKRYGLDDSEAAALFNGYYDSKNIAKNWMIAPNYKLDDLSTMLGITWAETHDATDDCQMTLQFLNALEEAITKKVNGAEGYPFLKTPQTSFKELGL